jgi:MFS family permease
MAPATTRRATLALLAISIAVFLNDMTIGTGLPVIPLYVHETLRFNDVIVGVAVGIQFLATILTRGYAGRVADQAGGSRSMRMGILSCALSGVAYVLVTVIPVPPLGKLIILIIGRLILGFGESQVIVGALAWGIGLVGQARSGQVLTWVGMAIFGALAVGAPIGVWLNESGGFAVVGLANIVLPAVAFLCALRVGGTPPQPGVRQPLLSILGVIWKPGLGIAFQGIGFAAIGSFVSLDYLSHGWANAGLCLSAFGGAFVIVRVFAGRLPDRIGGIAVAMVSLGVEAAGQALLWLAPSGTVALLGAAITGCGCSMTFPAFGVEIVKRVPPQSRGTALGGFAAFQDIAYATTGPIAGVIASVLGYPSVFAFGMIAALAGIWMTVMTWREGRVRVG